MTPQNLVFRNDDVNPSSDYQNVTDCYNAIKEIFPKSMIVTCVTLFSRYNKRGSVYLEVPFKNRSLKWFYGIDKFMNELDYITKEYIASHGLLHVNHAKLSKDAQEMSILTSCNFLKTNLFVPPFNCYNDDTINICEENDIRLLTRIHDYKSLECNSFDPEHRFWYFHSWKWKPDKLKEKLLRHAKSSDQNSVDMG